MTFLRRHRQETARTWGEPRTSTGTLPPFVREPGASDIGCSQPADGQSVAAASVSERCAATARRGRGGGAPPQGVAREAGSVWVRLFHSAAVSSIWDLRTTRRFLQENQLQGAAEIGGLTCGNNASRAPIMRYSPHLFSVHTSRSRTGRTSDKYRFTLMFGDPVGSGRPAAPLMRWVNR